MRKKDRKAQGGQRMKQLGYHVVHIWLTPDELHHLDVVRGRSPRSSLLKAYAMASMNSDHASQVEPIGRKILTRHTPSESATKSARARKCSSKPPARPV